MKRAFLHEKGTFTHVPQQRGHFCNGMLLHREILMHVFPQTFSFHQHFCFLPLFPSPTPLFPSPTTFRFSLLSRLLPNPFSHFSSLSPIPLLSSTTFNPEKKFSDLCGTLQNCIIYIYIGQGMKKKSSTLNKTGLCPQCCSVRRCIITALLNTPITIHFNFFWYCHVKINSL